MQKNRLNSLLKFITISFLLIVIVPVILFMGWIAVSPREIEGLAPNLEQILTPKDGRFQVKIDRMLLSWGGWQAPLQVSVYDAKLLNQSGDMVVNMPKMHVKLGIGSWAEHQIVARSVTILQPKMAIYQDGDGVFYLGADNQESQPIAMREIFIREDPNVPGNEEDVSSMFDSGLQKLVIQNANIHFVSDISKLDIKIPAADIVVKEQNGIFKGRVDFYTEAGAGGGEQTTAVASFFSFTPRDNHLSLDLSFKDLEISKLSGLGQELSILEAAHIPVSGKISLEANLPRQVEKLDFAIKSSGGELQYPEIFAANLPLTHILVKGSIQNNFQSVKIYQGLFGLKQADFSLQAELTDLSEQPKLDLSVEAENITSELVNDYWPKILAPNSRQWVKESVLHAVASEASLRINATIEELQRDIVPDEAILATISVDNAKLDYAEGFPLAENLQAVVTITGNSLTADIQRATMLHDTSLRDKAKVEIADLAAESMHIKLDIPLYSTASDVITFLQSTPYKLPDIANIDLDSIAGEVMGVVDMTIVDNTDPKPDDVHFSIKADISGLSQDDILEDINISEFAGSVDASDDDFVFDGEGLINGNKATVYAKIGSKQGSRYKILTTLPVSALSQFGLPVRGVLSGSADISLDWRQYSDKKHKPDNITLDVDMTHAELRLPMIGIYKSIGDKSNLSFSGELLTDKLKFDNLLWNMPTGRILASGEFDIKNNQLLAATLSEVSLGMNDFKGEYYNSDNKHHLYIEGKRLDISFLSDEKEDTNKQDNNANTASEDNFWSDFEIPPLDLQINLDNLFIDKGRELSNFAVNMKCDAVRCTYVDAFAKAGDIPIYLEITERGSGRILKSFTPDAGAVLRNLNIFDDMQSGKMSLVGIFRDELPTKPLIGKLTIYEHRVKNVPILAKLLTVATFTGILDALTGDGLMFQKLVVPFKLEQLRFTLKDAKTAGPSIGITANGSINLPENIMDIRGTVVPAYMFNTILSSIPLLGDIYGALAGDGLVAVNYSIKGDLDNADVAVNPLSVLTPGFLRGFFNIFDPVTKKNAIDGADAAQALQLLGQEIEQLEHELPSFTTDTEQQDKK